MDACAITAFNPPRPRPLTQQCHREFWQARREELAQTVQSLARMVERMTTEQEQLRAERDTLADCVRSLG